MYAIVVGIFATFILCVCCGVCVGACLDDEEENTTEQQNTRAQSFRRSLSNTSQRANAYLPPSYDEVVANTRRNFQSRLQRLSSINRPTAANSQQPSTAEVHIDMPLSAPVTSPPPPQELQEVPPTSELPPSYEDAVKT